MCQLPLNILLGLVITLAGLSPFIARAQDCAPTKWWRCPDSSHTGHCAPGAIAAYRYSCRSSVDFEHCNSASACRSQVETEDCAKIYSRGLCRPWWTEWSAYSDCHTGNCGSRQRSQRRHCSGLTSHQNPAAERGSCRDRRALAKMKRQGKPIGVRANSCPVSMQCPKINGGWSEWGTPSACSVSCGLGHRELRRMCNNPTPSGGGIPCSGFDMKRITCRQSTPCPLHGAWCPWSHVEMCDASCGIGVGVRVRQCRCPLPQHHGRPCVGPDKEMSQCLLAHCPFSVQLYEDERRFMRDALRATSQEAAFAHMGQSAPVTGSELYLSCGPEQDIRKRLFDLPGRFPERRYFWTKDNQPLKATERVRFDSEALHVLSVVTSDAGLYQMMVQRAPGRPPNTACFFPVPVLDTIIKLPEDSHFNLTCPIGALTNVTPTVMGAWRIFWSFTPSPLSEHSGGKPQNPLWQTHSLKQSLDQAGVAQISAMAAHMEGVYECYIQLMFVRNDNSTNPYEDPPPPDDDDSDTLKIAQENEKKRHAVLVLTNIELTDVFMAARFVLELQPPPSLMEYIKIFFAQNYSAILALFGGALTLGLCTFIIDCVRALLLWRRRIWLQRMDDEEMHLFMLRVREKLTGWTRENDRNLRKVAPMNMQDAQNRNEENS